MYLSSSELCAALAVPDLSDSSGDDPAGGVHALALLFDCIIEAATAPDALPHRVVRSSPLVATVDNYDALGFDARAITRDRRHSRYVSPTVMLRSHTSAGIPALLRQLEADGDRDEVLVLPGLVFRRDQIDRTHVAAPHQVDVWRVSAPTRRTVAELRDMVDALVSAVLPGARWREVPAAHPYTQKGRQIDVLLDGEWLELAECGLIDPALLARCGLDPERWSGLALGLGLDRALMLRKGIDDIRVLRSTDPRAVAQLRDLTPWRPISTLPPVTRDLSILIDEDDDDETLGDTVRRALGAVGMPELT